MKAKVLLLVYCLVSACAFAQVPILYYDFEDNSNRTVQDRNPDMAINTGGTIMNRIGSGFTTSALAGAGTLNGGFSAGLGFTSNGWPTPTTQTDPGVNATQYFQFTANTTGFSGISVYLDAIRNGNNGSAPTRIGVLWSADGSTFFAASTSPLTPTTSYTNLKFNLPTGADNQSSLVIRIYGYAAGSTSANLTIDNVMVNGSTLTASRTLLDHATLGVSLTSGYTSDLVFTSFTIDGADVVATLGGNTTLASLALGSGTLEIGSNTLTLTGAVSRTTGLVNAASGTVVLGGSSALTIPAMF
ncbi:MAG TPA: hypothetical protein VEX65_10885, partial [Flavisolibacter sp.]|nr:hypothetical protein [Flavisolibacter sp.]